MELTSHIPAPFVVHVATHAETRFTVLWEGHVTDLTAHLADLAAVGLLLGAPVGDAVVAASPEGPAVVAGRLEPDARTLGAWELSGPATATVLCEDGGWALDGDELGALAATGLLRAVADAAA